MTKLRGLAELDDPESLVVPILVDAILMAESYRGARHQITFLRGPDSQRRRADPRADDRRKGRGVDRALSRRGLGSFCG